MINNSGKAAKVVALLSCVIALGAVPASAATSSLTSAYSISFFGLNVGKMNNSIRLSDNSYTISGALKANSMISLVAKTKANFTSSGRILGSRVVPTSHSYSFQTSKKRGTVAMSFAAGDVKNISANPVIKYKQGTIPVEKSHLDNVVDPLSSLILAVDDNEIGDGRKICNRVVPVFDGRSRYNLTLSYESTDFAQVEGFEGNTFTCGVRYQAVSGIRPFKKDIKFMTANRDLHITVARVGDTNLYALFAFRARTDKGTATGRAYKFISR